MPCGKCNKGVVNKKSCGKKKKKHKDKVIMSFCSYNQELL